MIFEDALEQVVEQGAVRLYRLSERTAYVYRYQENQLQVRTLSQKDGEWFLPLYMAGMDTYYSDDGWYAADTLPKWAKPIELQAAKKNPRYYDGLTKQCHTCKRELPLYMFEREPGPDQGLRDWECNDCYQQYLEEFAEYDEQAPQHVGDYIKRDTHAAKPPVKGKI